MIALLAAALVVTGVVAPASARAQTIGDVNSRFDMLFGFPTPFHTFFDSPQKAIASDDRDEVAAVVAYPIRVRIDGKLVTVADAAHFVARHGAILTASVKRAVTAQTSATPFANW